MSSTKSGTAWAVTGMAALLAGRKATGLAAFARGGMLLEKQWRERHPSFRGSLRDRWNEAAQFYDATHQNKTNRYLHIAGIPLIVGGAAGLLAFKPYRPAWAVSGGAFALGWGLNLVGHAVFEKNAPAFKDDPLSFVAGPIWDLQTVMRAFRKPKAKDNATPQPSEHDSADESISVQSANDVN